MQAYEGYFENGQFYPHKQVKLPSRSEAVLVIREAAAPPRAENTEEQELRAVWLKQLEAALRASRDEDLPYIPRSSRITPGILKGLTG